MAWVQEFFDGHGSAWGDQKLLCFRHVDEEIVKDFAITKFFSLFKEHTRRLLIHNHVDSFESHKWTLFGPYASDARGQKPAGTSTGLAKIVDAFVSQLSNQSLHA